MAFTREGITSDRIQHSLSTTEATGTDELHSYGFEVHVFNLEIPAGCSVDIEAVNTTASGESWRSVLPAGALTVSTHHRVEIGAHKLRANFSGNTGTLKIHHVGTHR
jgi:hypothetical protein